jgi:superoxide reductase
MPATEKAQIFRCDTCGTEVIVTHPGGGTLVCCGIEMKEIKGGLAEETIEEEDPTEDEELEISQEE